MSSSKTYKPYVDWLNENRLTSEYIIKSDIYKYVSKLGYKIGKNLFIPNIRSMNLNSHPSKLRIVCGDFLSKIKEGDYNVCLMTGVKINNTKLILTYFGKSFIGYTFKTSDSNSFITFDYEELSEWSKEGEGGDVKKTRNKDKFLFYISTKFNECVFDNFYCMLNKLYFDPYNKDSKTIPVIPEQNKKIAKRRYEIKKNEYVELHHFIPKDYFIKYCAQVDWKIVHDPLNLVPLSVEEHHWGIHSSKPEMVKNVFNKIIKLYKEHHLYDDFIFFLKKNTKLKNIDELLNFYLNTEE